MPIEFKPYLNRKAEYAGGRSADDLQVEGKIFKLSSNENQLGSSPRALQAIKDNMNGLSVYPEPTVSRIRAVLSEFYDGDLSQDQFVPSNSGVANIEMIMRAFLEPGTKCIISTPAFVAYKSFAPKMGAEVVDVPLVGDMFHLDVDAMIDAIDEQTRLIFLTSPNNPTGTHIPKSQVDDLVGRLPDHVVLVYDEVYYQYVDAEDYVRGYEYVKQGKNVVAVNSFSKAYGLAGLRVGYSYSTPELATYLRQLQRPFFINSLSLEAAMAALGDKEFIRRTQENIWEEKAWLYRQYDRLGIEYWKTQGNFILIRPASDAQSFADGLMSGGVMVRPADSFDAPGCLRITIGTREGNERLITLIEQKGLK